MRHCDDESLANLVLDDAEPAPADRAHLAVCRRCASRLAGYRDAVSTLRTARGTVLLEPPVGTWGRVESRLRESTADAVVPITERRDRRRWMPLAVAAGIGIVFGGMLTGLVTRTSDGPPPAVVASAALLPIAAGPAPAAAPATARVQEAAPGRVLSVQAPSLAPSKGYYEVWLLDPETSGMVSLGTVAAGAQSVELTIPEGLSVQRFSVVDVSDEPLDGDPAHSTVSVLRGRLTT